MENGRLVFYDFITIVIYTNSSEILKFRQIHCIIELRQTIKLIPTNTVFKSLYFSTTIEQIKNQEKVNDNNDIVCTFLVNRFLNIKVVWYYFPSMKQLPNSYYSILQSLFELKWMETLLVSVVKHSASVGTLEVHAVTIDLYIYF